MTDSTIILIASVLYFLHALSSFMTMWKEKGWGWATMSICLGIVQLFLSYRLWNMP